MSELTARLEAALAAEQLVAQLTRLSGEPLGAKRLCFPDGECVGTLGEGALDELAQQMAQAMMGAAKGHVARSVDLAGVRCFVEIFPPPPQLLIFGGVHVAVPLVNFAKTLGFRVTLVDPRTTFANAQRFPQADELIPAWPQEAIERLHIGPSTFVAILTHDPKLDEPALQAVLGKGAAYVGAIGSRHTHAERFQRMAGLGVAAAELAEVYAPIGLDLHAASPEEIALAIMAEIVAVRRGGSGGFMRAALKIEA